MRLLQAAALAGAAMLLVGAAPNWLATVALDGTAHRIGNPEAKVRLTEYVSYTCPHCAEFNRAGEGALQLGYIASGKISVEVRHLIRDPVDLTVAVLAHCGPESKFPQNHTAFLSGQAGWIGPLTTGTAAQQQRWRTPGATGRRAIATDFGLYRIMERRGYTRAAVDRCLADDALVRRIVETSDKDWDRPGIDSTPSFAINGVVMPGTHTWPALSRQLDEFVRRAAS
ncbi:MAG TPA: thioredoxin domain-containing protein [Solirubrobacterales bacterium]|nr:thioredoxin domain-containing protein [Solirubrobacterales bacterium]